MAYTTLEDIQLAAGGADRLLQLTDHNGDQEIDTEVLAAAQAQADTWINAFMRRLYDNLPFVTVPAWIRTRAAQETVYVLLMWRRMVTEQDLVLHQERQRELESVNKGMIMVSEDNYPLGDSTTGRPALLDTETRQDTLEPGVSRPVTRDTLKGFW